jgi:hypothetical protein
MELEKRIAAVDRAYRRMMIVEDHRRMGLLAESYCMMGRLAEDFHRMTGQLVESYRMKGLLVEDFRMMTGQLVEDYRMKRTDCHTRWLALSVADYYCHHTSLWALFAAACSAVG